MSGTTLTLRPSSDVATADWTLVGAANFAAALADNSDASYAENQSGAAGATLLVQGFPGFTLPTLSQLRAVAPRYRFRLATVGPGSDSLKGSLIVSDLVGGQHSEPLGTDYLWAVLGSAFATAQGVSRSLDPAGNPWTVTTLQTIRVQMRSNNIVAYSQCQIAALYLDILYNLAPVVTVTGPSGTVSTSTRPPIQWTYTDPEGDVCERTQTRIFTAAQIAALSATITTKALTSNVATLTTANPHGYSVEDTVTVSGVDATFNGNWLITAVPSPLTFSFAKTAANVGSTAATGTSFSPNHGGDAFWFSGEIYSAATSITPTVDLPNGSYSAYVYAADAGSNGRYGMLGVSAFTVALTPPPAPSLTATYDSTNVRNVLTAQAATNLATANQADVETDATGFVQVSFSTVARSTSQHSSGVASLATTSTGAGTVAASTTQEPGGWPVAPNAVYTGYAELRANTTVRTCRVGIMWFNATGVWLGTTWSSTAADTNSGWTTYLPTGTSPATAYSAAVTWEIQGVTGAGEIHYVDKIGMWPGMGTTWTRGGLSGITASEAIIIEFSDDGGTTWTALRGSPFTPSLYQGLTAYDYTLPATVARIYRARVSAVDTIGNLLNSANSSSTAPLTLTIPRPLWRLVDPVTPTNSVYIRPRLPDEDAVENMGVFRPLGRVDTVVVSSAIGRWDGTLVCVTLTDAEATALEPAFLARNALWLISPSGSQNRYIRLLSPRKRPHIGGSTARTWSAPFVAVAKPS